MSRARLPGGVGFRVPWGVVAAAIALAVASAAGLAWLITENREREVAQWEARLGAMATDRARGVERWVVERLGDARVLAAAVADEEGGAGTRGALAQAVSAYGYAAGWLLDVEGAVLDGTTPSDPHPDERELARRALTTGEAGSAFSSEPERHVSFAAPLPGGRGAVVLRADPERFLFPFLQSEPVPTRTGEALLGMQAGDSVAFLNHPRKGVPAGELLRRSARAPDLAMAAALEGRETFGRFVDYLGAPVLAATRRLESAPWGIVVKVDREEALAGHRRFVALASLLGLSFLVAVVAGLTAYHARRRARERTAAAEALRSSEEKHRALFEQSRDAIFLTTPDGRLLDVNPACAELFGVDPDRLESYEASQFYADPADRQRFRRLMAEEGGVTDFEVPLRDTRGRTFEALYSAGALRDASGSLTAFQGTVRDITDRKEAERRIRASEERLRLTYRHAPVGVAMVALDGTFTRANPALARMLGYEESELVGKTFQELTHPDDLDEDLSYVEALLSGEIDSYELEKRYLHRDGSVVWVHLTGSLVRDARGEPLHFVAHVHDVSEQMEARAALEVSEHRFRALIEQGAELISLIDPDGITRYQSPAFQRTLGYPEGALVGVDSFELVHPDDRDRIRGAFEEILERPGGRARVEYRFRHANGAWRVLETRALNLVEDPAVAAVVVNSRDVTERREMEAAVEESRTRLQAIVDTVTEGVVLMDREGSIRYANPALEDILGVPPAQMIGRRFDDPAWEIRDLGGTPLDDHLMPIHRVVEERAPVRDILLAVERPDGREVVLSTNAAPILDEDGGVRAVVASVQDVTERIRADREIRRLNLELEDRVQRRTAELRAANEELEAFAYSVSHDLRAPLRALDGFSQALVEDYGDELEGQALHFLERIQAAAQRMSRLIDEILQLSRVSRREMRKEEVDLAALARDIMEELEAGDPGREVELRTPERIPAVGDPDLLRSVLQNLLENAWKFTAHSERAIVEVGMEPLDGGERGYFVRDNGVGFDMAYADKLFRPFHRLHRESEFEGTGVGLATVQRIVRRHRGRVEAEGAEGQGATIRFTLG